MMRAAAEAAAVGAERHGVAKPIVAAVTVLTSMDTSDLDMVGQRGPAGEQVGRLAQLTKRRRLGRRCVFARGIGSCSRRLR